MSTRVGGLNKLGLSFTQNMSLAGTATSFPRFYENGVMCKIECKIVPRFWRGPFSSVCVSTRVGGFNKLGLRFTQNMSLAGTATSFPRFVQN